MLGWLWFNQPPADFATLTNRLAPDQLKPQLDETRELLANSMSPMDLARRSFDPFNLLTMPALTNISGMNMDQGNQMFASTDGKYRLLYLQSAVDLTELPRLRKLVEIDSRGRRRIANRRRRKKIGKTSPFTTPAGRYSWKKSPRACNTT